MKDTATPKHVNYAQGDDSIPDRSELAGVDIPLDISPISSVKYLGAGGREFTLYHRCPPGEGPFPVVLFFHGGMGEAKAIDLKAGLLEGAMQTRFLKRGYAVVQATRRAFGGANGLPGDAELMELAAEDCLCAVRTAAKLPFAGPGNPCLYAGSAGGAMALECASKEPFPALVLGEPAAVLMSGMFASLPREMNRKDLWQELDHFFNEEHRARVASVIESITSPCLFLHGKDTALVKFNRTVVFPLMKECGIAMREARFPGLGHGFYWGRQGATVETVERIIHEADAFFKEHTSSARQPL